MFKKIYEIATSIGDLQPKEVNRQIHETLAIACREGLRNNRQAFGNLFSQVDYLCKLNHVSLSNKIAIQAMRYNSNRSTPLEKKDILYDLHALAIFVSAVTHEPVPGFLLQILPNQNRPYVKSEGLKVQYVRCIVDDWNDEYVIVSVEGGLDAESIAVDCTAEHLIYILRLVKKGMQLNLLDCTTTGEQKRIKVAGGWQGIVVKPRIIVVEPDYLLDISAIAACFTNCGHHPLSYVLDRMKPRANSSAILMGNFAGSALDGIVNFGDDFSFAETLKENFREKALEYCTCTVFDAKQFKEQAEVQTNNIKNCIKQLFEKSEDNQGKAFDRSLVVLEPSFVCERLGLQGRVDMMTTDFKLLVEQKAGRNINIEFGRAGRHGIMHVESHFVQAMLYYGILFYNNFVSIDKATIEVLYSKYPPEKGLIMSTYYDDLFKEAIKLRNEIVAMDFKIAQEGFETVLPSITPKTIITEESAGSFVQRYLLPQLEAMTLPLQRMSNIEREYFCRMMTFIYRERLMAKVGAQEGVNSCSADLWNMPISEKIETGNIYIGLTIKAKEKEEGSNSFNIITLSVPEQGYTFLPNFRRGDVVYLYQYARNSEPDVRKSILYKGNIKEMRSDEIVIALLNGQQNPAILNVSNGASDDFYAVEHADSDMAWGSAMRGLHEFITAPDHRKDLILGLREPERDATATLTRSYEGGYNDILLKAKQANDYFLLLGPPGTGKTSMALRFLVEEELASTDGSILLMAYTNRAVDEICSMLDEAALDYLRIGNEYSADPRFKSKLLSEAVKGRAKLSDIKQRILSTRIITGTTSTLMLRSFVFDIKSFSLAIIDEASQILEPSIVGLLAVHRTDKDKTDCCKIRRFILIGDHKQLPAVVQQSEMDSAVDSEVLNGIGLDNCRNSLFERLLRLERKAGRQEYTGVLCRYGRMHPEVAEFPNRMFYHDERLVPVLLSHQRENAIRYAPNSEPDALDRLLRTHRMIFIPSLPCQRLDISDKVNTDEAAIVANLLYRLRTLFAERFDPNKSVGVIVPYRNQIAMIRQEIEKYGMKELESVSIDTIERYQGSQRDVIIYSFTIQHPWQLEFLTANCFMEKSTVIDRKLNVAMTRARCQMIMIGNEKLLNMNPIFRQMIRFVRSKGGALLRKLRIES